MILTREQIIEITKRRKFSAQIAALRGFGLEVKIAPTGEPIVAVDNFRMVFQCEPPTTRKEKPVVLNFGALKGAAA